MAAATSSSIAAEPLQGRTAIVTGGTRGIGRAVSLHLASLGARLVLNYSTNSAVADQLAAELNSLYPSSSPRAIAVKADVIDAEAVKSLFDAAEHTFGSPAHILVCCAGVLPSKYPSLATTSEEVWDKTMAVNAKGTFLCCREAANRLVRGGGGRIITFSSSIMGTLLPGYSAYTASNAAVEVMTKILAKEIGPAKITANVVAPGPVKTELFMAGMNEEKLEKIVAYNPQGRIGETSDIAPVVGFLATDAAGWVNGQVIRVNGGFV